MVDTVCVIGAAGHVGFPFSLVVADVGHKVYGIDISSAACDNLNNGIIPFIEKNADQYLEKNIKNGNLFFTPDSSKIAKSDIICIMLGTPMDAEGNPRLDYLLSFVENELLNNIKQNQIIILRSTISPGTTELIKKIIEDKTGWIEGINFHLVFAPERVAQGLGIEESKKFPQMIGAFTQTSYNLVSNFFESFSDAGSEFLTPKEAEYGKLMTNMYRYVNFALANEFYMLAARYDVDVHKVTAAINKNYPRMNLPLPGPNVGGPCLFKDGKFLVKDIPYADLIQNAFLINEGMPQYIMNRLKDGLPKKIAIFGMTFKAENDDIRNSLSFKLKKLCRSQGIDVVCFDPYLNLLPDIDWKSIDAIVIMTPHKFFIEYFENIKNSLHPNTRMVDIWKLLEYSKHSATGIYDIYITGIIQE